MQSAWTGGQLRINRDQTGQSRASLPSEVIRNPIKFKAPVCTPECH